MGSQKLLEIANALTTSLNLLQHCSIQMKDAIPAGKAIELISASITVLNQLRKEQEVNPQEVNALEEKKEEVK